MDSLIHQPCQYCGRLLPFYVCWMPFNLTQASTSDRLSARFCFANLIPIYLLSNIRTNAGGMDVPYLCPFFMSRVREEGGIGIDDVGEN